MRIIVKENETQLYTVSSNTPLSDELGVIIAAEDGTEIDADFSVVGTSPLFVARGVISEFVARQGETFSLNEVVEVLSEDGQFVLAENDEMVMVETGLQIITPAFYA